MFRWLFGVSRKNPVMREEVNELNVARAELPRQTRHLFASLIIEVQRYTENYATYMVHCRKNKGTEKPAPSADIVIMQKGRVLRVLGDLISRTSELNLETRNELQDVLRGVSEGVEAGVGFILYHAYGAEAYYLHQQYGK